MTITTDQAQTYTATLSDFANYPQDEILQKYAMLADNLPILIVLFAVEGDTYRNIFANGPVRLRGDYQHTFMQLVEDCYGDFELTVIRERFAECIATRKTLTREMRIPHTRYNQDYWIISTVVPIFNDQDQITHILSYSEDISERKRQEQAQAEMLAEISMPLLSISDTTVVMPLIGTIDSHRIQNMNATLLQGVAERQVQNVILDITGVPVVDTQVANALLQVAQAVRLLGARILLCGIRPEVAQVLVSLGINLNQIPSYASLQAAIAASKA